MKIFLYFLITTLFCLEANAKDFAKSDSSSSLGSVFNFDIYSLSKKKENAFDVASATYIVNSEDIRRSGVTSIPEALRLVPGVQVSRVDGNKWAISVRGFDYQFSNKLLVMIDGRTIYTPLFSGVFWDLQDYVIEDIEKIEVVRGPGGTIWGANAVNGVINIITKNAAETQGGYVSQVVGNQDKSITEIRYGGKTSKNDHYRIYAKKTLLDGAYDSDTHKDRKDGNRQERAGFRYDITSIKDGSLTVQGDIFSSTASNYFTTLDNSNKNDKNSNGFNLSATWDKTISRKSSINLQTYIDYDKFSIPVIGRSSNTIDVDLQHFYNFSKNNQFIWGLGYRQISDKIESSTATNIDGDQFIPLEYNPSKRNSGIFSAFIQDKIGLIEDKLYWTVGSKFLVNNYTKTGFEYQPNTRLTYYPSRNQTLWGAISRAVRTPTRGEMSFNLKDDYYGQTSSKGSSDAESENVLAYELGYRIKPTTKTLIDITTFYNKYSKLRTYEDVNGVPTAANLGYGQSYGGEIVGKWQVSSDLRLEASYDYLEMNLYTSKDSTDNSTVSADYDSLKLSEGRSPRNQFRLRSYYNVTPKIEFDNMLYYVDSLPSAKYVKTDRKGVASYVRFDTRVGYLPTKSLDLSVGIRNLFDDRHQEFSGGFYNTAAEIGRTYYVKAVWQY
ncbi:MAG: TonB-dependent receptor [Pelagibacterales bacterium]|nr:TonB-dependent receptor [Pelagibacterales bacterium]